MKKQTRNRAPAFAKAKAETRAGRPPGARNKTTLAVEALLDGEAEALTRKAIERAKTADQRLDKIAQDFVEHCTTRWEAGKSLFVCIDKITCARIHGLLAEQASWR